MDTRFWGPSGWRLLHLIAADTLGPSRRKAIAEWFALLEYVLPCKYCRASFHDYLKVQPLTKEILATPATFSRWLYDIHNRVNGKLRGQGLLTTPDPDWPTVHDHYAVLRQGLCRGSPLLGWDFMTSVAFSTPAADYVPTPMPDYDAAESGATESNPAIRNRYNLMTRQERLPYLRRWWALIPSILPCEAWRRAWSHVTPPPLDAGRAAMMRWMWRVESSVCQNLRCPTPHPSLRALRDEVGAFESGCGASRSGNTCRTRKIRRRDAVHSRRRKRGQVVL
jgi:hypothetical protein